MLDLANVRCFVVTADELHFGRAAARLNMTQPPLSRRIQLLEQSLGVLLLQRNNRKVSLTAAGQQFLPEARLLLRLSDQAEQSVKRKGPGDAGQLSIGFTAVSGYAFIPEMVLRLKDHFPNVDLKLAEMVSADQIEAVLSGQFDIGFVRLKSGHPDLQSRMAFSESLVLALPDGHRLAANPSLALADIADEPFIGYEPLKARYFFDMIQDIFRRAEIVPSYVQYLVQAHSALALVATGLGVALVPTSAMNLRFRGVCFRDIDLGGAYPVNLQVIWRKTNINPVLSPAIETITSHQGTAKAMFDNKPAGGLPDHLG